MAGEERTRPAKWDAQSRCGYQVVGCVSSQGYCCFYTWYTALAEVLWSTFAVTVATATTITPWAGPACWDSQLFLPWPGCPCGKSIVGSCLKALQPAASDRYDLPNTGVGFVQGNLSYLGYAMLLLVLGPFPRVSRDLASSLVNDSDPAWHWCCSQIFFSLTLGCVGEFNDTSHY